MFRFSLRFVLYCFEDNSWQGLLFFTGGVKVCFAVVKMLSFRKCVGTFFLCLFVLQNVIL